MMLQNVNRDCTDVEYGLDTELQLSCSGVARQDVKMSCKNSNGSSNHNIANEKNHNCLKVNYDVIKIIGSL